MVFTRSQGDLRWLRRRRILARKTAVSTRNSRRKLIRKKKKDGNLSKFMRIWAKTKQPSQLHELPLHIQKKLLGFLPLKDRVRLESVCKMWRQLLLSTWSQVTELDIPTSISDLMAIRPIDDQHVCGFLRKCGAFLSKIDFFFLHGHIGEHVMHSITNRCPNLRELQLTTDVSCDSMTSLLKTFGHQQADQLTKLGISYHAEVGSGIHNGLRVVTRHMTSLREFRLDSFKLPPTVTYLFPNSPNLKVYGLLLLQPSSVSPPQDRWRFVAPEYVEEFLLYLADMYPTLEEFDLSFDTNFRVNEDNVNDLLRRIGSEKPLRRVNLRISYLFEDVDVWFGSTALKSLAHFNHLTDLSLWACKLPFSFLNDLRLNGLGARLTNLRLCIVRSLSHNLLSAIFESCPNLQYFTLLYSAEDNFRSPTSITYKTISTLVQWCPCLLHIELIDCQHVDLRQLIPQLHKHFHKQGTDLGENNILSDRKLQLSFKTSSNLRLRTLTRLAKCCTQVERIWDGQFTVVIEKLCKAQKKS